MWKLNLAPDGQRYRAMVRKEFTQLFRDPQTLRVMLIAPLMQMMILGYAVTNDPKDLRLGVLDQDRTQSSRTMVQALAKNPYFVVHPVDRQDALLEDLDAGRSQITLQIPPGFERRLARGEVSPVQMMADGSDTNTATLATAYLSGTVARYGADVQQEWRARRGGPEAGRVEVRGQAWYNPSLTSRNYILPGVAALIVTLLTSLLTVLSVAREREVGTLEQLMVTPLSTREFMLGKMTPPAILAFVAGLFVVAITVVWFRVPFRGSLPFLMVALVPFIIANLGFGLLISSVARSQQQAMLLNFMNMMPQILLSGFMFPLEAMPGWARAVGIVIPMRYFLDIVRGLYMKASSPAVLWPYVAALVLLSAALLSAGMLTFRRRLD